MSNQDKQFFEQCFSYNFNLLKDSGQEVESAMETALEMARHAVKNKKISDQILESWSVELYEKHNVDIELPKPTVLREQPVDRWYDPKSKVNMFFWRRYREYLSRSKRVASGSY
ncbi:hypothetical protein C8P63_1592 [Melghirimyces profundicolus]|uniref:Uncharacterized protein n=1 Tax=Melghirimyces profundicolus TaxID=1242148 RepID=A0A2T6ARS4_9BACL|nr:hypothetical protein [Melghirimyces profundicolus]PTX46523.1 hypothetical protein C8P63_1592 [Melghirimyces profundicolus]